MLPAWSDALGDALVSVVLFGSVARGEAREESDIDVLVIADGFPRSLRERRQLLLDIWPRERSARALPFVEWNLVSNQVSDSGKSSRYDQLAHGPAVYRRGA